MECSDISDSKRKNIIDSKSVIYIFINNCPGLVGL